MQEQDGSMRMLDKDEAEQMYKQDYGRVVSVGKYFKIGRCYFCISDITPEGILARGVSRKEYYDSKRR